MADYFGLPPDTRADVRVYKGSSPTSGISFHAWRKPRGATMIHILALAAGGNGGLGAQGAASTAAGGGGGGSGGQSAILVPAHLLPDQLCIIPGLPGAPCSVFVFPDATVNSRLLLANNGGNGGNAAGATAGAAGAAGAIATMANAPLMGMGITFLVAGQAGIIGGTTGNAGALTLPVTGLVVTGGTGGGGLPALSTVGGNGGAITGAGILTGIPASAGGAASNAPGAHGSGGYDSTFGLRYHLGGTGGGAGGLGGAGNATAAGGNGGAGGYGCGGGGAGGGFTGSTAGAAGRGGPGLVIITAW